MIDRGDDEAGVGERLGCVVMGPKAPPLPCETTTSGKFSPPIGQFSTPDTVIPPRSISPDGSEQGYHIAPLRPGPSASAGTSIKRKPAACASDGVRQRAIATRNLEERISGSRLTEPGRADKRERNPPHRRPVGGNTLRSSARRRQVTAKEPEHIRIELLVEGDVVEARRICTPNLLRPHFPYHSMPPRKVLGLRGESRAIAGSAVHEDKGGFAGTAILKGQIDAVVRNRRHGPSPDRHKIHSHPNPTAADLIS
jgi:hypothetical protein